MKQRSLQYLAFEALVLHEAIEQIANSDQTRDPLDIRARVFERIDERRIRKLIRGQLWDALKNGTLDDLDNDPSPVVVPLIAHIRDLIPELS